jgi:hypothetical protein
MELGEFKTVGRGRSRTERQEPDTATKFLANTLANIAAWRAQTAAQAPISGAAEEVAVRFTSRELELVVRLLAADAGPEALRLLESLSSDEEERVGDVSTGEWVPHQASDVLSEQHSSLRMYMAEAFGPLTWCFTLRTRRMCPARTLGRREHHDPRPCTDTSAPHRGARRSGHLQAPETRHHLRPRLHRAPGHDQP